MKVEAKLEQHAMADPLAEAVTVVAAQISLALQEAQPSVERLGASVGRMIVTLGSISAGCADRQDSQNVPVRAQVSAALVELQQDAVQATVAMQFHDRMAQNLMHLHDYLASVGELLASKPGARADGASVDLPQHDSPEWRALRENLLRRLVPGSRQPSVRGQDPPCSDAGSGNDSGRSLRASTNTIELF